MPGSTAGNRIDIHHHVYPPDFTRANLEHIAGDAPAFPRSTFLDWTPQFSLEQMDACGIATTIGSITSPGVWFGDNAEGRRWARVCNEYGAKLRQDYPGRFGMFAAIPLPDRDGSLKEIEYSLDVLKHEGVGLVSNYSGRHLGDPGFAAVFEELNRRKAVVFVHPTTPPYAHEMAAPFHPPILEFPFETTRTIASLLFNGTLHRCPDIRFIFPHGGGALPIVAGRLQGAVRLVTPEQQAWFPNGVEHELRKLYYDVVGLISPSNIAAVTKLYPVDHLLFGSDVPFWTIKRMTDGLPGLGLPASDLAGIERGNALKLMPQLAG